MTARFTAMSIPALNFFKPTSLANLRERNSLLRWNDQLKFFVGPALTDGRSTNETHDTHIGIRTAALDDGGVRAEPREQRRGDCRRQLCFRRTGCKLHDDRKFVERQHPRQERTERRSVACQ